MSDDVKEAVAFFTALAVMFIAAGWSIDTCYDRFEQTQSEDLVASRVKGLQLCEVACRTHGGFEHSVINTQARYRECICSSGISIPVEK